MADINVSTQEKGYQNPEVSTPLFIHPLLDQATTDEVLVDFDGGDDPYRPMNWPFRKKVITTILYGLTTCWITFASAVYSATVNDISREFHIGYEVSTLGTSLFVVGFGLGPLIFAPLSELYGRKPAVLIPYFVAAVFSFGAGAAKDIQTILITRFFAGFFGSAPITATGGVLGDIWSAEHRGIAVVGYAITLVGGPTIAPIVGGAFVASNSGWRWTEHLTGIVMMVQLVVDICILDESYAPTLLARKAASLRHQGGNWALHAKHEEWEVSLKELSQKYLIRPFLLLATPICFLVSVYAAFVYGLLYANLGGFAIVFQGGRGWGPVVGSLPFLAMFAGVLAAAVVNIRNNKYYFRRFTENGNRAVPEARLPPMMIGGVIFAGGLFLFGWTSSPNISSWPSIIGIVLIGFGFTTIFQAALNYLIDTFTWYAASAVAAATFLRSIFACAFPLFIGPLYHHLGVDWGTTVFACLAVLLIPVPFVFFFYGPRIRASGK